MIFENINQAKARSPMVMRRQGDLLFRPIDLIPSYTTIHVSGDVVALGETTGHKHKFRTGQVQLYKQYDTPEQQVDFIEVAEDAVLAHEEHAQILLPKGKYAVVHEREYNPFTTEAHRIRQVED